ncbi:hypothetical protein [Aureivirga sp. CE67]|uniref:hypothetical protein n=1 Tax=Aureivirga sp. CE67 TaxID=1788983 RepID=UPI001E427419|nr:hypothetical protein [Aureivirga sp. CE67]
MRLFLIMIVCFLQVNCANSSNTDTKEKPKAQVEVSKEDFSVDFKDNLLEDIQQKIMDAFVSSVIAKNPKALTELETKLEDLYKDKKQDLILYWIGYLDYYKSIYYYELKQSRLSEEAVTDGINKIKQIKNKNTEYYAILGLLENFSLQYARGMNAMTLSKSVKENADMAMNLDANNVRAYYVAAVNDYYTPVDFGGKKKAEKLLLKAISLPAQKVKNNYMPSWGKEESYELLIKFYLNSGNKEKAKEIYQKGIKEYPDSYLLKELASKLI